MSQRPMPPYDPRQREIVALRGAMGAVSRALDWIDRKGGWVLALGCLYIAGHLGATLARRWDRVEALIDRVPWWLMCIAGALVVLVPFLLQAARERERFEQRLVGREQRRVK